jgi:hypothetical protein
MRYLKNSKYRGRKFKTEDTLQTRTPNSKPRTPNSELRTSNPEPQTPNHELQTPNPERPPCAA